MPFKGHLPEKYQAIFSDFSERYKEIAGSSAMVTAFAEAVIAALKDKEPFGHFHKAVRSPIDFYALGLDLFRPIVDMQASKLVGLNHLKELHARWENKENIFLFANHQSEADPQLLSLLLEKHFPKLAEEIIFVAGERVVTDPLAVPFSRGRNLLCIYSKKYFDIHKDKKAMMQEHNKKSIQILGNLLDEGGKCIYIAPSGGRDRRNSDGEFAPALFDPQSIQLCRLLGSKAKKTTHFYPLALNTHGILPPPDGVQAELGEMRKISRAPIAAGFGKEIIFPSYEGIDKEEKKKLAADFAWDLVNTLYCDLM